MLYRSKFFNTMENSCAMIGTKVRKILREKREWVELAPDMTNKTFIRNCFGIAQECIDTNDYDNGGKDFIARVQTVAKVMLRKYNDVFSSEQTHEKYHIKDLGKEEIFLKLRDLLESTVERLYQNAGLQLED